MGVGAGQAVFGGPRQSFNFTEKALPRRTRPLQLQAGRAWQKCRRWCQKGFAPSLHTDSLLFLWNLSTGLPNTMLVGQTVKSNVLIFYVLFHQFHFNTFPELRAKGK